MDDLLKGVFFVCFLGKVLKLHLFKLEKTCSSPRGYFDRSLVTTSLSLGALLISFFFCFAPQPGFFTRSLVSLPGSASTPTQTFISLHSGTPAGAPVSTPPASAVGSAPTPLSDMKMDCSSHV
jgi:hypothetical protein